MSHTGPRHAHKSSDAPAPSESHATIKPIEVPASTSTGGRTGSRRAESTSIGGIPGSRYPHKNVPGWGTSKPVVGSSVPAYVPSSRVSPDTPENRAYVDILRLAPGMYVRDHPSDSWRRITSDETVSVFKARRVQGGLRMTVNY
jgi:hypothetical protein